MELTRWTQTASGGLQVGLRRAAGRLVYLVNGGQAVDDAEHNDGVAVRIVGDLNRHGIQQHLVKSIGQQRLGQLAEKVLQHACSRHTSWRRGVLVSGGVRRMNEVNARRARLVPGWVTVFGRVYHLGM